MHIHIIVGSTREGRLTERVAKWVEHKAKQIPEFEVEVVDLADYQLPLFDETSSPRYNPARQPKAEVKRWLIKLAEADGYVIVTPEYNHSVPGVLKNALDYVDFQFAKKPAAIVSHGTVGGARAAEHLKGILVEMKAAVVPEAVALLGRPGELIQPDGTFAGETSNSHGPDGALANVLHELSWWTSTLAAGRATVAK